MKQSMTKAAFLLFSLIMCAGAGAQTVTRFIDPANMDFTVKPGDDFYTYAGGTWLKNNPVPAKETRWGSFNILRDFNINAVRKVLETAAADKNAQAGSVAKRVADFYTAGMDSVAIENRGAGPVMPYLKSIAAIQNKEAIISKANELRTQSVGGGFFSFFIGQDRKNVEHMVPQTGQGGTTLPDRDYYLKNDAKSTGIQEAYKKYMTTLFTLVGNPAEKAAQIANSIYELEKKIAAAQKSRVEMRDAYKTYNKFLVADFSKTTPSFDWKKIMNELKVKGEDSMLVNNPSFFASLDSIFIATSLEDLKAYLQWNVLKGAAPHLSSAFVDANFNFYSKDGKKRKLKQRR